MIFPELKTQPEILPAANTLNGTCSEHAGFNKILNSIGNQ